MPYPLLSCNILISNLNQIKSFGSEIHFTFSQVVNFNKIVKMCVKFFFFLIWAFKFKMVHDI